MVGESCGPRSLCRQMRLFVKRIPARSGIFRHAAAALLTSGKPARRRGSNPSTESGDNSVENCLDNFPVRRQNGLYPYPCSILERTTQKGR